MDDFLEYVRKRRSALKRELAELDSAERIYLQSGAAGTSAPATLSFQFPIQVERPTIKDGILQILSEVSPNGLTALEILERLNRRWWRGALQRTSLSPQITRLKADGKVINERGTWKAVENNAPPDDTEGAL